MKTYLNQGNVGNLSYFNKLLLNFSQKTDTLYVNGRLPKLVLGVGKLRF